MTLDRADAGLLSALALIFFCGALAVWLSVRKDRRQVERYPLYAVRDELLLLVARGRLAESEFLFQLLYGASNFILRDTRQITLKFMAEARQEGLDPAVETNLRRIIEELPSRHEDVRRVFSAFFHELYQILYRNSFALRMVARLAPIVRALRRSLNGGRFSPNQEITIYRDYERAQGQLAA